MFSSEKPLSWRTARAFLTPKSGQLWTGTVVQCKPAWHLWTNPVSEEKTLWKCLRNDGSITFESVTLMIVSSIALIAFVQRLQDCCRCSGLPCALYFDMAWQITVFVCAKNLILRLGFKNSLCERNINWCSNCFPSCVVAGACPILKWFTSLFMFSQHVFTHIFKQCFANPMSNWFSGERHLHPRGPSRGAGPGLVIDKPKLHAIAALHKTL